MIAQPRRVHRPMLEFDVEVFLEQTLEAHVLGRRDVTRFGERLPNHDKPQRDNEAFHPFPPSALARDRPCPAVIRARLPPSRCRGQEKCPRVQLTIMRAPGCNGPVIRLISKSVHAQLRRGAVMISSCLLLAALALAGE